MHLNQDLPFQIVSETYSLNGIIRGDRSSEKMLILLPAQTGTRIGPQRIYTEIAIKLTEYNVCSLCIDLPQCGDSYDQNYFEIDDDIRKRLSHKYQKYLDIILDELRKNYSFKEFILLSISMGCMPIYDYSVANNFERVILLSPNHLVNYKRKINIKNLRSYFYKFFQQSTWFKIFTFKVNYKNILRNLFIKKTKKGNKIIPLSSNNNYKINVLCVFGERDPDLIDCKRFWKEMCLNKEIGNYTQKIISNADHSFFGWELKRLVEKEIINWLNIVKLD